MTGARIFSPGDTLVLDSPHTRGIPDMELQEVNYRGPLRGTDKAVVVLEGQQMSVPMAWLSAPAPFPLCSACADSIGGACAGPDAPWRPATEGEACGADNCCMRPDDDEGGAR